MKQNARELTQKIAKLARLSISDKEIDQYAIKFKSVIEYVEKLNELNTENVEPMAHTGENETPLREDIVIESTLKQVINLNAPECDGHFYQVPKIIEES
ncbi:MAG: Asp-tRNA(Asn)/Glu-tRNA(Gln) amidotransferase GatCAB subunit C [Deltaproteobacteria bacterium CG07_land_8_20_14_0_80_38_7]|nr:MAG: Asp-tRNA(Asn)/Glu-tRNA(Gln) amidotransferase GatCAB subunit C [Deltaproteobacteria bacterium CG07_land_8_20_14_0_80_38_7]